MEIRMMNPAVLNEHVKNFRRHPVHQLNAIRKSIDEFGWLEPILYNERTERLLNGHARVYVAKKDGVTEVPVHLIDVDEGTELRILASLQRTNDLGLVDERQLQALLSEVNRESDLPIPGWDERQLQAMLMEDEKPFLEEDEDDSLTNRQAGAGKRRRADQYNTAPPPSRIIHLYLTDEMDTKFKGWIDELEEMFGTSTVTETVIRCMEHCLKEWKEQGSES